MKFILANILIAVASGSVSAAADTAEFYKGKSLTILASSSAGGGYDTYSRLLGRHIGRHVPGTPGVVVQNMPGGGGLVAANYVYNVAPKDGTAFWSIVSGAIIEHIIGNPSAKLDGRKFSWIGVIDRSIDACVAWSGRGIESPEDFLSKAINLGAAGASSRSNLFPKIMQETLAAKFKIILGYDGTPDRIVAMELGELDGACGISISTVQAMLGDSLSAGKLKIVLLNSINRHADFPNVPLTLDYAQDEPAKQVLMFMFGPTELGRPFAAPPGVPADRAQALRAAFDMTMKDVAFLADAKKIKADVDPMSSSQTLALIEGIYATPRSVVEKATPSLTQR